MKKINFKNVAIIIGVAIINILVGVYDKVVNDTGIITSIINVIISASNQDVRVVNTFATTSAMSFGSNSFTGVGAFILVAIGIITLGVVIGGFSLYAGKT